MRKPYLISFIAFIFTLLLVSSCSKDKTPTEPVNSPPVLPSKPSPANNKADVSKTPILTWECSDPDNDPLTYDIYLGTSNNPTLVENNISQKSYIPDTLTGNTKYYWKVVAKDNHNNTTNGEIWNFTTNNPIPTTGLVVYYPFNSNANDESGNNNNGTVNGAILTNDRFGNSNSSYQFTNGNYIETQPSETFPSDSMNRTISVWVKSSDYAVGNKFVIGWGVQNQEQKMCALVFGLGNKTNGKPGFWGWGADLPSNSTLTNDEWYNIVFVYEKGKGKLYINGELDAEKDLLLNTPSGTELKINGNVWPMSNFVGIIDDIRIYKRALSEIEIQALYHEGGW